MTKGLIIERLVTTKAYYDEAGNLKPDKTTEGVIPDSLDTVNEKATEKLSATVNNANGEWRFIAMVTMNDGAIYPGEVYIVKIESKFQI